MCMVVRSVTVAARSRCWPKRRLTEVLRSAALLSVTSVAAVADGKDEAGEVALGLDDDVVLLLAHAASKTVPAARVTANGLIRRFKRCSPFVLCLASCPHPFGTAARAVLARRRGDEGDARWWSDAEEGSPRAGRPGSGGRTRGAA